MEFEFALNTDIGLRRKQNQDSVGAHPELGLFVVADGMGGHRGGETASALAVEHIYLHVKKHKKKRGENPKELISDAVRAANRAIFDASLKNPALQGMGTTTTAMLFVDNLLVVGHVGDSRCYYIRPQCLWQVTRDHSLVQEKLRAGLITREQLKTDVMKNVITRSVGFESDVNVEVYEMPIQPGDAFLICSDGLSGMIEDAKILEILQKDLFTEDELSRAVENLIHAANDHGGEDNITGLVVQVMESARK
ncbi:Stp1/IreP family PP2C-type Ser/Thr phosphatase [bacterium]|jgi:protein phosphatase|nr:Stp1/IreP family PP2C-type Ser/Thr phosphatase [bacterium]